MHILRLPRFQIDSLKAFQLLNRTVHARVSIMYIKLNQNLTANPGAAATPLPLLADGRPVVAVSPNAVSVTLRLQRSF